METMEKPHGGRIPDARHDGVAMKMISLRTMIITTITCAGTTTLGLAGDGDVFDWINPAGGEYKNPLNWAQLSTPQFDDDARFDIVSTYTVTADVIQAASLLVGRSNVTLDLDCGQGENGFTGCDYVQLDRLLIGDGAFEFPRELDNPGSLTFTRTGSGFTDEAVLGNLESPLASRLIFQNSSSLRTENLAARPESSVYFKIDVNSGRFAEGILTLGSGLHDIDGSFVLETDPLGMSPVLGQEINLVTSYYSSTPPGLFPLRVLRPRPARAFEIEWESDGSGNAGERLFARLEVSDTVSSVSLGQSDELGSRPNRLIATDLDDDGRDDLVVLIDSGVINVYRSLPNGLFDTPVEYDACSNPVDVTASDFDGDGTTDLAIGCEGDGTLLFYLNPDGDPSQLVEGPSTTVDGEIRSLAHTQFITSLSLVARNGATVTTRVSSGKGRTKGYLANGPNVIQVGDVEVGDEPGPSDPIDDENKKDPDSPIGVGGDTPAAGFNRGAPLVPSLMIVQTSPEGSELEVVRTIPLTGRAVDFDSADLDGDGNVETLVVTDNGHLDLLRTQLDYPVHSIHLDGTASSIAIGDLEEDGRPEIVIGMSSPARLEIYRVIETPEGPQSGKGRGEQDAVPAIALERYAVEFLGEAPTDVAVTTVAAASDESEVIVGLPGGSGVPSVNVNEIDRVEPPACTFADFNGDGVVDAIDLAYILGYWGPCSGGSCTSFDLNDDGEVGSADLGILFISWGDCSV